MFVSVEFFWCIANKKISKEKKKNLKLYFKEKVFNTIIPRLVRLSEAPSFGKSIIAYDQKSSAAQFYIDLAKEVVKNNVSE